MIHPSLPAALLRPDFQLGESFDFGATFFFAMTGALAAIRRRYDYVGLFALALVAGVGGSLLRDGLFLQDGPPAVARDGRYLAAVLAGCLGGVVLGHRIERFRKAIAVLDAIGLCVYGVVGAQKSLAAGLSAPAAILVGVINACGGGLARDIITREEPLAFKPGQFYALASCAGCALFVALATQTTLPAPVSALIAMTATFLLRFFAIIFNWRTSPVQPWFSDPDEPADPPGKPKP